MDTIVTLVIFDPHLPYQHKDFFRFVKLVKDTFKPTQVFFTGDEVDNHAISFHDKDPDSPFTAGKELEQAIILMDNFYKMFPVAKVCNSNHGSLVYRKGKHAGLSRSVFKEWSDILEAPAGWSWHDTIIADLGGGYKAVIKHGTGSSKNALITAKSFGCCYIQGHHHSTAHIQYFTTEFSTIWGCTGGCGIDHASFAFVYQKENIPKPCLNVLITTNGIPFLVPMIVDSNNDWVGRLF